MTAMSPKASKMRSKATAKASKMRSRSSQGIQKDVQGHSSNHRRFIHACLTHRTIELKGPAAGVEALHIYIYILSVKKNAVSVFFAFSISGHFGMENGKKTLRKTVKKRPSEPGKRTQQADRFFWVFHPWLAPVPMGGKACCAVLCCAVLCCAVLCCGVDALIGLILILNPLHFVRKMHL